MAAGHLLDDLFGALPFGVEICSALCMVRGSQFVVGASLFRFTTQHRDGQRRFVCLDDCHFRFSFFLECLLFLISFVVG